MTETNETAGWELVSWVDPATHGTPIVATIGPAVFDPGNSVDLLSQLLDDGVAVFRINFSHVTRDGAKDDRGRTRKYSYALVRQAITRIRELERQRRTPVPIMMDLRGPKIRVKRIYVDRNPVDSMTVETEETVMVSQQDAAPDSGKMIVVEFDGEFAREAVAGNLIRIDDGRVELRITLAGTVVAARATRRGTVALGKSVNLPRKHLVTVDSVTRKDEEDLSQCFDVDLVGQSFVRSADDVGDLHQTLKLNYEDASRNRDRRPTPRIIAKIETAEAVQGIANAESRDNAFLAILEHEHTFGVMVARGDLGSELDVARVPAIQELLLDYANRVGKPAIVATQMLETMMTNPVPVRAEVEDIWSAVREGADAVMLSGETAGGEFPVRAVQQMRDVLGQTRLDTDAYRRKFKGDFVYGGTRPDGTPPANAVDVVGYAIVTIAEESRSPFIITYATQGRSAARIARFRPKDRTPILALTLGPQTARILRLLYSVCPVLLKRGNVDIQNLPRERRGVIELARHVIGRLVALNPDLPARLGRDWEERFMVATLADEEPEYNWDEARDVVIFRYR
jgi:pyruvate kinase